MIPFEALLPWGVILGLMTVAGGAMNSIHSARNNGKRDLYGLDKWDRQLIERDFRLTGAYREQSDKPIAPEEFKTNSWWKVEKRF
ncbi:NIMM subunit of mitochondrial NADH:ubiquinone oxidoreductase (complex I), putative [Geotrichum candidum]|uniref:NADH dehydrogenase [ubiquinone] 1 alpha subcomplex subunit 1 n=1 Tax=Geotrichum candidum TaxID=1173061 RepID=A0A0J9XBX8_GEOCN|nr:NIMM subunit of mitochondrial NADH:ubiquinone oxidoreductase (complex I), putative [Geotrichum candidum]